MAASRRILMLINNLGPAGAESQVLHLAAGLARDGHQVTVACQRGAKVSLEPLVEAGVRVLMFGAVTPWAKLRILPLLVRLARAADVVHCTMWDPSLWGRLAAVIARRPVVVSEHTPGRDRERSASTGKQRGDWIAWHNRILDPVTYATVACARWQVPLLRGEGVAAEKIVHIPNGVPVDELDRRAAAGSSRRELGIPDDATVIMHVARFQPQKNQPATLELVRRLRRDLGDVRAVFVGDGPLRAEVQEQAEAMGAGGWAHFLGARGDVPALLRLADLFVLPSFAEAMPMAIIEALALGVPVVATDVGDVRGVLELTGGGTVVPVGDDDAYERACRQLLVDRALHDRVAREGRERSREHYDSARMVSRYSRLLRAAADREPVPAG